MLRTVCAAASLQPRDSGRVVCCRCFVVAAASKLARASTPGSCPAASLAAGMVSVMRVSQPSTSTLLPAAVSPAKCCGVPWVCTL
eukprot:2769006-Amphidinium_carterae.1